ncbi:MAG: UbiA family prenyltransferase [Methanosarcina sp.]|nr:UbiA family prenyltransferase [Methanosarcina sp.]
MYEYEFMNSYRIFGNCNDVLGQIFRTNFHGNATLKLLKSSVMIAISGMFRVYIASILLQIEPSVITCIAGGLIIYSVYTLDRALDSEEDKINRMELDGSRKEIGLAASILTFVVGSYVLTKEGMIALAFLPFITGFLYSKGIKIGRFALKLKGGLGVKNFVVGLTWGAFITGLAGITCKSIITLSSVFVLYGVKTFVNSVIDDFKDVKGDSLAGIKTLPICLGESKTQKLLLSLHLLSHIMLGVALIKGVIAFEPLVLIGSFICGLICIKDYTKESISRRGITFFKDGESIVTVGLRTIVNMVLV